MKEQCFGPIRFIPGENRGKYPYCHSVYIDGEGILIDPASDRDRLKRLRDESGDRDSSIQDTIASIERLKQIPATTWLTCHETGIFEENPADIWGQYLAVIDHRESQLLDFLNEPRTMADIVGEWIVYQRPREPQEFYAMTEEMIMQKHLDLLISKSKVVKEEGRYRRVKTDRASAQ